MDRLRAPHKRVPEYLTAANPAKRGGEFDANTYFTVLPHLRLPEGRVLDWVMLWGGMGAEPVLYVRDATAAPFATYDEYRGAGGTAIAADPAGEALSQVATDDSPEGYLELAILHVVAVDFYRYWPAGYNDWRVPTIRELEALRSDDLTKYDPAVDIGMHSASCGTTCANVVLPECSCTAWEFYGSATTLVEGWAFAWGVDFNAGDVYDVDKHGYYRVRAVRAGL